MNDMVHVAGICNTTRRVKFYLFYTLPVTIPLLSEVFYTLCYENYEKSTIQFRMTTLLAKMLNQEKCLELPAQADELEKFVEKTAKTNSSRKLKFVIIEDVPQISL